MMYLRYGLLSYKDIVEDIVYARKFNIDHIEIDLTKIKPDEIKKNFNY